LGKWRFDLQKITQRWLTIEPRFWQSMPTRQGMTFHFKQGSFMSTIEQIDQLVDIAEQLGYRVRYDYFGGTGGGVCEFSGNKFLFLDLALTSTEQLEQLQNALANEPLLSTVTANDQVKDGIRRAA
jgi:hypothetical protein